jgi:hypothetical protein
LTGLRSVRLPSTLPGVAFRGLAESPPVTVDFNCIYRRDDASPILQAFLETIRLMRDRSRKRMTRRRPT